MVTASTTWTAWPTPSWPARPTTSPSRSIAWNWSRACAPRSSSRPSSTAARRGNANCLTFLSSWGDRRATRWIDEATGLFVGEAAEAYLSAVDQAPWRRDNLDPRALARPFRRLSLRAWRGGRAKRACPGRAGGAPNCGNHRRRRRRLSQRHDHSRRARSRRTFGARAWARRCARRSRSCACRIPNRWCPITSPRASRRSPGACRRGIDRVQLLTQAIAKVQDAAGAGGNRVLALTI